MCMFLGTPSLSFMTGLMQRCLHTGKKWELKDSPCLVLIYPMHIYERSFMGKKLLEEIFIEKLIGGFLVGLKHDNYVALQIRLKQLLQKFCSTRVELSEFYYLKMVFSHLILFKELLHFDQVNWIYMSHVFL